MILYSGKIQKKDALRYKTLYNHKRKIILFFILKKKISYIYGLKLIE